MEAPDLKTYPNPCLRVKTKKVEFFDQDLKDLSLAMSEVMYESGGIGLAAPQIGVGLSVFVMDIGEGLSCFVNPEILESSSKKTRLEEGCLSIPGITVSVARPDKIKVRAYDENGKVFLGDYEGLAAKAVQHEMDHLRGKIIIDYLDPVRYFFVTRELMSYKNPRKESKCEVVCRVGKRNK